MPKSGHAQELSAQNLCGSQLLHESFALQRWQMRFDFQWVFKENAWLGSIGDKGNSWLPIWHPAFVAKNYNICVKHCSGHAKLLKVKTSSHLSCPAIRGRFCKAHSHEWPVRGEGHEHDREDDQVIRFTTDKGLWITSTSARIPWGLMRRPASKPVSKSSSICSTQCVFSWRSVKSPAKHALDMQVNRKRLQKLDLSWTKPVAMIRRYHAGTVIYDPTRKNIKIKGSKLSCSNQWQKSQTL